jgi:hypothetical protein
MEVNREQRKPRDANTIQPVEVRCLRNAEGSSRLDRVENEGNRRGLKIQSVRYKIHEHGRKEIKNLGKMIDERILKNRFYSTDENGDENGVYLVKDVIMGGVGRGLIVSGLM